MAVVDLHYLLFRRAPGLPHCPGLGVAGSLSLTPVEAVRRQSRESPRHLTSMFSRCIGCSLNATRSIHVGIGSTEQVAIAEDLYKAGTQLPCATRGVQYSRFPSSLHVFCAFISANLLPTYLRHWSDSLPQNEIYHHAPHAPNLAVSSWHCFHRLGCSLCLSATGRSAGRSQPSLPRGLR
jgi:hypothetical protein